MKRLGILIFMLLLMIPLTLAQGDTVEGDIELFGSTNSEIAYVFQQEATGGSMTALEDSLYELTLEGIDDVTTVLQVSPPGTITYQTASLASDWSAAVEAAITDAEIALTQVEAELTIEGVTLALIINDATYDPQAALMTYQVELVQYIPNLTGESFDLDALLAGVDKFDIPTSFDDSTLTISATTTFWESLATGGEVRRSSLRDGENPQCDAAREALANTTDQLEITAIRAWITANCN